MHWVKLFISRPKGVMLMAAAMAILGLWGYFSMPVASLPQINYPVITVRATQPGGSPSEIAGTISAPLERRLGIISGLREMTSKATQNQSRITLQFDLSRDINDAARDVEAALRAARTDLPSSLKSDPTYVKANSNGSPVLAFNIKSDTRTIQEVFDFASNILLPMMSQSPGVGQVDLIGASLPALRVETNPLKLSKYGISFEDVRAALMSANAHSPKGLLEIDGRLYNLSVNDQASTPEAYENLIIAYRQHEPIRMSDVARVIKGPEDLRQASWSNGKPQILVLIYAQAGTNVVKVIDGVKSRLPFIREALPQDVTIKAWFDDSKEILSSLNDTRDNLILAVFLVVCVVALFLRNARSTFIAGIVTPISLLFTFFVMKITGCQLDKISLMAVTIASGFVIDDAIVVIENIERRLAQLGDVKKAVLEGTTEIGFTVFSITVSLLVVFVPVLVMPGMLGKFFHEFAIVLMVSITASLWLSLTLTPTLCSLLLSPKKPKKSKNPLMVFLDKIGTIWSDLFDQIFAVYKASLNGAMKHKFWVALSLPLSFGVFIALLIILPKQLAPSEDQGLILGRISADQSISFHALQKLVIATQMETLKDPAVKEISGGIGRLSQSSATIFVALKDPSQRDKDISVIVQRLNKRFAKSGKAAVRFRNPAGIGGGARSGDGAYQITLLSDSDEELNKWTPKAVDAIKRIQGLADVSSDLEENGKSVSLNLDRDTIARYHLTPQLIANTIYDAFGQRSASILYNNTNQYRIILEAAPKYWETADILKELRVSVAGGTANGAMASNNIRVRIPHDANSSESEISYRNSVANALAGGKSASSGSAVTTSAETTVPLSLTGKLVPENVPISVAHQGLFTAASISFNLAPGVALSTALDRIHETLVRIGLPHNIQVIKAGEAKTLEETTQSIPFLLIGVLGGIYIVLGVLYENLFHPLTILSTLPSAGVGALLGGLVANEPISLFTFIGIVLLMGIVKKNAIMLVDFAIIAEQAGSTPYEAIHKAALLRFRPIMMTTVAAGAGAVPLLIGNGYGSGMRHPLGVSILGGLCVSQVITLYSTPALYLYVDRLQAHCIKLVERLKKFSLQRKHTL